MHEYTYYMDDSAYVTDRRVKLGDFENDLADIKWVGVEERVVGGRVGRFAIPSRVPTFMTGYVFATALIILLVALLPWQIMMIAYPVIASLAFIMHGLMRWLGKRGHRQYWLGVSGTFGMHYAMASMDEQHLKRIAEAIKQAMRDRYASVSDRQRVGHVTDTGKSEGVSAR